MKTQPTPVDLPSAKKQWATPKLTIISRNTEIGNKHLPTIHEGTGVSGTYNPTNPATSPPQQTFHKAGNPSIHGSRGIKHTLLS